MESGLLSNFVLLALLAFFTLRIKKTPKLARGFVSKRKLGSRFQRAS